MVTNFVTKKVIVERITTVDCYVGVGASVSISGREENIDHESIVR